MISLATGDKSESGVANSEKVRTYWALLFGEGPPSSNEDFNWEAVSGFFGE